MRVSDAKQFIKILAERQIPISPLLVGPMGCGKSEIVKQAAEELGIGLVDLRLAQMEPGDLIGIPYRDGNITKWAFPNWFPNEGTSGILFLDEINRAPNDVRQTVFQLIWDRKMHQHVLPKGWLVVSAMNPDGNNEYQVETLDKAMLRRFCVLNVEPNVDDWMTYAMGIGKIASEITGFISTHPSMLFESEPSAAPIVKRNNAAWGMVNMLYASKAMPRHLEFEIVSGMVGREAAVAFLKYMEANYERPVTGKEVLSEYQKVRDKVIAQRKKADEMHFTIKQVIALTEELKRLNSTQMRNLKDFLFDLTADFQTMFVIGLPTDIVTEMGNDRAVTSVIKNVLASSRQETKNKEAV